MAEPKSDMALAAREKPPTDKWEQVKQTFLDLYQAQASKSDTVLTETIRRGVGADPLLGKSDLAHMQITAQRGVATLSGHVIQTSHKVRAEAIAHDVPAVTAVVNHLIADNELMIGVAQALGHDPQTENEQIQVNIQHGVVYLGGAVNRVAVRTSATKVAARIPQVRGVINVIQTPGSVLDADEERFVQPLVDSAIYATDGQVGRVQQVVIDPQTRRVTAVVVYGPLAVPKALDWTQLPNERLQTQHTMLVPIHGIRCAPSGALFLSINSGEATHFADFDPRRFGPPAAEWQPPYPYVSTDVLWAGRQSDKEGQ